MGTPLSLDRLQCSSADGAGILLLKQPGQNLAGPPRVFFQSQLPARKRIRTRLTGIFYVTLLLSLPLLETGCGDSNKIIHLDSGTISAIKVDSKAPSIFSETTDVSFSILGADARRVSKAFSREAQRPILDEVPMWEPATHITFSNGSLSVAEFVADHQLQIWADRDSTSKVYAIPEDVWQTFVRAFETNAGENNNSRHLPSNP